MPKEVFEAWIEPHLGANGFPLTAPTWNKFFCNLPIRYWAALEWDLQQVEPRQDIFDRQTILRIGWIIGNAAFGLNTPTADIENTRKRFWAAAAFVRRNRRLPGLPIVGDLFSTKIRIVDGHHRLAALFHIGVPAGVNMAVWVGSI